MYGNYRILRAESKKNAAQYQLENVGESGESAKPTLTKTLTLEKNSDIRASSVIGESGECVSTRADVREGGIYPPPDESSRVETVSPDSPKRHKDALQPVVNLFDGNGESQKVDSPDSPKPPSDTNVVRTVEVQLLKSLHDEFRSDSIPTQKMIRHAKTVGYDLTQDNHAPAMNMDIIASQIAGKELNGLKLHSSGDGEYAIATLKNEKAQRVEEVELL